MSAERRRAMEAALFAPWLERREKLPASMRASAVDVNEAVEAVYEVSNLHQSFWKDPELTALLDEELRILEYDLILMLGWVKRARTARGLSPLMVAGPDLQDGP